ncbi:MAG: bifunctional DedA family/phosphatase PAP2 family protein [Candidatus Binatia bacterium]
MGFEVSCSLAFFGRHGGKAVFIGRFIAWLRAFAPVVAGISRMPYLRFLLSNMLGGIAWATTFSVVGYFVGNSWEIIREHFGRLGMFAFMSGVSVIYSYFLFTRKREFIQEKVGWIDRKLSSQMPKAWALVKDRFRVGRWYGLNLTTSLLCLILAVLSFGEIVEDLIDRETLFYLDFRMQRLVKDVVSPAGTNFMVYASDFGGVYLVFLTVIVATVWLLIKRDWWNLFGLFLVAGVGKILQIILKILFHRPRPVPQLVEAYGYSFPSGHAFSAMIVYGFLVYMVWKFIESRAWRVILVSMSVLLIVLVGMSRIYLNVHWLTDVLGGYVAGFAWLIFSIMIASTMKQMTAKK